MDATNLWLTPLILLPGVALLIMSTSARLNRLHDEVHEILQGRHAASPAVRRRLAARSSLFRDALVLLYVCVALFAVASLLGMAAALWEQEASAWLVLGVAAGGVLCLAVAALQLIRESLLSIEIIREHQRHLGTPDADAHEHD